MSMYRLAETRGPASPRCSAAAAHTPRPNTASSSDPLAPSPPLCPNKHSTSTHLHMLASLAQTFCNLFEHRRSPGRMLSVLLAFLVALLCCACCLCLGQHDAVFRGRSRSALARLQPRLAATDTRSKPATTHRASRGRKNRTTWLSLSSAMLLALCDLASARVSSSSWRSSLTTRSCCAHTAHGIRHSQHFDSRKESGSSATA